MDADDNGIYRLDSATVLLATVGRQAARSLNVALCRICRLQLDLCQQQAGLRGRRQTKLADGRVEKLGPFAMSSRAALRVKSGLSRSLPIPRVGAELMGYTSQRW